MAIGDPCQVGDMAWILKVEGRPNQFLIGQLVSVIEPGNVPPETVCCDAHRKLLSVSWLAEFARPVEVMSPFGFRSRVTKQIFPDAWLKPHRPGLLDDETTDTSVDRKEGAPA